MEKGTIGMCKNCCPRFIRMAAEGKSQREIVEELGLKDQYVVKRLLWREHGRGQPGVPKQRGRKPAKTEVLNIIRTRLLTQSKRCPLQFPKGRPGLGGTADRFRVLLPEAQQ